MKQPDPSPSSEAHAEPDVRNGLVRLGTAPGVWLAVALLVLALPGFLSSRKAAVLGVIVLPFLLKDVPLRLRTDLGIWKGTQEDLVNLWKDLLEIFSPSSHKIFTIHQWLLFLIIFSATCFPMWLGIVFPRVEESMNEILRTKEAPMVISCLLLFYVCTKQVINSFRHENQ